MRGGPGSGPPCPYTRSTPGGEGPHRPVRRREGARLRSEIKHPLVSDLSGVKHPSVLVPSRRTTFGNGPGYGPQAVHVPRKVAGDAGPETADTARCPAGGQVHAGAPVRRTLRAPAGRGQPGASRRPGSSLRPQRSRLSSERPGGIAGNRPHRPRRTALPRRDSIRARGHFRVALPPGGHGRSAGSGRRVAAGLRSGRPSLLHAGGPGGVPAHGGDELHRVSSTRSARRSSPRGSPTFRIRSRVGSGNPQSTHGFVANLLLHRRHAGGRSGLRALPPPPGGERRPQFHHRDLPGGFSEVRRLTKPLPHRQRVQLRGAQRGKEGQVHPLFQGGQGGDHQDGH